MLQKNLFFLLFLVGISIQSQTLTKNFYVKKLQIKQDTIQLDSVAINSQKFRVLNINKTEISKEEYSIDFNKTILIINSKKYSKIIVEYYRLPDFITKIYTPFDEKLILQNNTNNGKLYSLTTNKKASEIKLFEGLQTSGYISRGVTSGNNQNAVTNSALDLEIFGKLSKEVTLKAHIFDTNIPIQENGYSQNITDFDRIFIEMYTNTWKVKAGDINLQNNESYFMPISKQLPSSIGRFLSLLIIVNLKQISFV